MRWEEQTIDNLIEKVIDYRGKTPKKSDEGIKLVTAKIIKNGRISLDGPFEYIKEETYEEVMRRGIPQIDDILITTEAPLGEVAIIKSEEVIALAQRVILLRTNKNIADAKFIYQALKTPLIQGRIFSRATGTTVLGIKNPELRKVEIPTPPLPTQHKIASILSAYDDLIENNLRRIKLLEEKASLMYKLMQKELTVAEKINLYDFADIQMGFAFKAEAFNEEGEGIPIIRIRDIPSQMTKSYTTQEVDNQYWLEKGDLLIGMDGEFHMNEWLGQRGYLVQRVCRLCAKNELYQSYLWQALKEPIHYYEITISGATVAHLGKKHLLEIFIAQPKDSMKDELEKMNTMRKLKIVLAEQNTKLQEARDILLPKLMNGQIEV